MSFSLEIQVKKDDEILSLGDYQKEASAEDLLESDGFIVPVVNGEALLDIESGEFEADPLIGLVNNWMQKMPWLIAGDEECVPLRNSPFCYGFEPVGNSVRFYFYEGTEGDVENLILEPVSISLADFCQAVLNMGKTIVEATANTTDESEELGEFSAILSEFKEAWNRKKHER